MNLLEYVDLLGEMVDEDWEEDQAVVAAPNSFPPGFKRRLNSLKANLICVSVKKCSTLSTRIASKVPLEKLFVDSGNDPCNNVKCSARCGISSITFRAKIFR
uniref:Uncharacterized protein n=1 Tax=Romanomermis culicivorax TaxID=13658 RepID=A0A915KZZ0_ROMCU